MPAVGHPFHDLLFVGRWDTLVDLVPVMQDVGPSSVDRTILGGEESGAWNLGEGVFDHAQEQFDLLWGPIDRAVHIPIAQIEFVFHSVDDFRGERSTLW